MTLNTIRSSSSSKSLFSAAVSTPLNVDKLVLELVNHPDCCFVNNFVNALRDGTRIGYLGPQKAWVSRNLISASQHPEVVCTNLAKEIQLGRIAGPFPSYPLPNFQCHPIGVVPKKYSAEWRTIYHLESATETKFSYNFVV